MELSGNAQRALEQVKMGLYMLYGANYFTEEEWIKIDGLIHKGKYVFTKGPPTNILEEEEELLMTFEETRDETKAVVQVPERGTTGQPKLDAILITEELVSSSSSEPNSVPSPPPPAESPDETPLETSDEGDSCEQPPPTAEQEQIPAPTAAPATLPQAETKARVSSNNSLPPGCTQEQLDEVRAFNATLTKAGQKTRPKYEPVEDYPPSEWEEDFPGHSREEDFPGHSREEDFPEHSREEDFPPASTENAARINTWADGVAKGPHSPSPQLQSPTPSHAAPRAPVVQILAEQFIKSHGRAPKSLNDFYQPNNPEHHMGRPASPASVQTSKTAKSIKSTARAVVEQLTSSNASPHSGIVLGKIYIAQSSAPPKGIRIEIRTGDAIKVVKFVSGVMYIGENQRSKERGQFPESIFKKVTGARKEGSTSSFQRGLDQVEKVNAAEWDEVSIARSRSVTNASVARPYGNGGLAASRFSVLADREPSSQSSAVTLRRDIATDMAGQIGQIINDRVDEILKARGEAAAITAPRGPARPSPIATTHSPAQSTFSTTLSSVPPKTDTCWFWSVKNDCRFTAEECRDLHAIVPNKTGTPTNLRNGKPTWGALADSYPSSNPNSPSELGSAGNSSKANSKTCYYWAVEKSCSNTAESCKYLHAWTSLGVAPKPSGGSSRNHWQKEWRKAEEVEAEADESDASGDGEFVLEEVPQDDDVELDGWGQPVRKPYRNASGSTWGEEKYKPPHIKAMEESVAQDTDGW